MGKASHFNDIRIGLHQVNIFKARGADSLGCDRSPLHRCPPPAPMRTNLELPDPLFARLKARASTERLTLKQLLRSYVEQGVNATPRGSGSKRSAHTLPPLMGPLAIGSEHLSNAALFDLLDA